MDPSAALERLADISSQVRAAVVFERGGKVLGSTFPDDERAGRAAEAASALLTEAERRGGGQAGGDFAQLEVAVREGSVFVVRHGERLIVATTPPEPTVGLVFYDLKSCLRELETPGDSPKKKPKPAAKRSQRKTTGRKKTDAKP
jgi:predicted regulator of Ras-like GTPase activity (Roadblock/LC7/MglB family)